MADRTGSEGLFAALRNLLATLVATGRSRLQLFGIEVEEESIRLRSLAATYVGALILLGVGVILLIVCLAAAFWEHRVLVFGLSALVMLAGGFFLLGQAKKQSAQPSALFRASIAELDADLAHLRGKRRERP